VRLGIEVPENRIVLAGSLALDAVAQRKSKPRLAVFGSDALRAYAASRGLETQSASPDCILLARDLAFDFLALTRLIGHLTDGAELIVTNEDTTHPGADGRLVPETGALLAAVRSCLPGIAYTCFGKPHAAMYQTVLERGGVEPGSALAIGDNPATDGLGAKTAGIDFVLVGPLSGRFPALAAVLE
jgi:HAD superfamily hydrolase (TIGR01450 family)